MSKELIEKIDELENQIDNVDQKFTGALDKLSDSMEKVAIALVKLDAQEETQKNLQSENKELRDMCYGLDKQVNMALQAVGSTDQNTKDIKSILFKVLMVFVSGFFSIIIAGIIFLVKS